MTQRRPLMQRQASLQLSLKDIWTRSPSGTFGLREDKNVQSKHHPSQLPCLFQPHCVQTGQGAFRQES